ncbi:MAG: double-strand break repair helicase AddA [Hyphomonadaceae bacterium]|nr:MAG: double-strand break repair helicase AddA [Caulobacteraceae bacterium]MBT9447618.1 double-strand break repair helicase AddA [Hyphomonadaceae bacterium]TPW04603.1 MAG: double-strand break repair helicase AddA [Alphaproteobacteria bacterium]
MSRPEYLEAQNAQRIAADPAQSVFVTANAGSGKTKVLVDRIARLLLGGAKPSAFLCITFTKAAAAEMQRRLFERLGAWCVADDEKLTRELVELGEPTPDAAHLMLARALFAQALETPGGLRIQTIHGFCERLVGRFPLEAGVAPGFEIADDARGGALIAMAWARAVADGDAAFNGALDRFGVKLDSQTFEGVLATLAGRRGAIRTFVESSQGLSPAVAAIATRHRVTRTAEEALAEAHARCRWDDVASAAERLGGGGANDVKAADRIGVARADQSYESYRAIFLKANGEPHAASPTKKTRETDAFIGRLFVDECERIAAVDAELRGIERADDARAALVIGAALGDAYEKAKASAGVLDFEDLIDRANDLLTLSDAAPWVLFKLDGGFDHILIDEGQDTSPAQWKLVEPLQTEFFSGAGASERERTVFAVGDFKQSIYSFQGADPAHFLRESQALSTRAAASGKLYAAPTLSMSFRSTPDVLRAVDATFEGMPVAADAAAGEIIKHSAYRIGESGRVEWWPLASPPTVAEARPWDAPKDIETGASSVSVLCAGLAAQVKAWIDGGEAVWEKGVQRPMRPGDVLALVRSRGPLFSQLLRAFKRAGLPVAGADRMTLSAEIAAQDLLAAARVALDPTDDLSLATLLKSPWIGLVDDDADIFPLTHGRVDGERLIDRLRVAHDRYATARVFVQDLIVHAHVNPHVFFSRILERTDDAGRSGWEQMIARLGHEARDPAEELLARALACGRQGPATLQHFVHAIERDAAEVKRETEQGDNAVRVMTVHGAKGLEAPVVLLADTSGSVKSDPPGNIYFGADGPVMRGAKATDDDVVADARRAAEEAARLEHSRLLYVAMTRAKDRLVVCGHARGNFATGAAPESWWCAVETGMKRADASACETPFGAGLAIGEAFKAKGDSPDVAAALALPDWARRVAPTEGPAPARQTPSKLSLPHDRIFSPRADGRARFRRGTLIHGLLQRLPDVTPERRIAAAVGWLAAQGAPGDEAEAYAREALRVLDDPAFAEVFGPGSRAEAPLVATLEDGTVVRGVIDRMVVTAETVLLLDFKTDRPPPALVEDTPPRILAQMAAYRAALRLIFPDKVIRSALLWTEEPRLAVLPDGLLDAVRPADARC